MEKMKKCILLVFTLVSVLAYGQQNAATTERGVVINGVKWATCNVDNPGTFAAKPESAGKFYQWNRKQAWVATGETISGWDSSVPRGTTWAKSNDPSPVGWRMPTLDEIKTLLDENKVSNEWATVNGVNGRRFTDIATGNSIFLPAAGYRLYSDGTLISLGSVGVYWSSEMGGSGNAYGLYFTNGSADWGNYGYRRNGDSVRSVAE